MWRAEGVTSSSSACEALALRKAFQCRPAELSQAAWIVLNLYNQGAGSYFSQVFLCSYIRSNSIIHTNSKY